MPTWSKFDEEFLLLHYVEYGPKKIATSLNKTEKAVQGKALSLGLRTREIAPKIFQDFKWTEGSLSFLAENYHNLGPGKVAEILRTSLASVSAKAKRIGIQKKRINKIAKWTEEMLETLCQIYATADPETLVKEIGLPLHVIRHKARNMRLQSQTRVERMVKTRTANNTSCNIHYFDTLGIPQSYILGFIFADGNLTRRLGDIIIGISIKDIAVLDYIKEETESKRVFYRKAAWVDSRGHRHSEAVFLTLASKIMANRLMELGLRPGKTHTDEPFPVKIPIDMLPHFIRGYFDGDGAVISQLDGRCAVRFIGSPKMIEGIRDRLVEHTSMSHQEVRVEVGKTQKKCKWGRVGWAAREDVQKFFSYIYPPNTPFCLERKHRPLLEYLSTPRIRAEKMAWTAEEEQIVKDNYTSLGPKELAKRLNRSYASIRSKAKELGLYGNKKEV